MSRMCRESVQNQSVTTPDIAQYRSPTPYQSLACRRALSSQKTLGTGPSGSLVDGGPRVHVVYFRESLGRDCPVRRSRRSTMRAIALKRTRRGGGSRAWYVIPRSPGWCTGRLRPVGALVEGSRPHPRSEERLGGRHGIGDLVEECWSAYGLGVSRMCGESLLSWTVTLQRVGWFAVGSLCYAGVVARSPSRMFGKAMSVDAPAESGDWVELVHYLRVVRSGRLTGTSPRGKAGSKLGASVMPHGDKSDFQGIRLRRDSEGD